MASGKPSFAKIAAVGIRPQPTSPNEPPHENSNDQHRPSSPGGSNIVSHSHGSHLQQFTPTQKKLKPLMAKEQATSSAQDSSTLQVSIHNVDGLAADGDLAQVADGVVDTPADESAAQGSTSSDSGKPPSLDGKSVASGTTFALDEKESLRPDDSASVKAGEDEDMFPASGAGIAGSRLGSEDGTRAFGDQLREISRMGPPRQSDARANMARGSSQGVLYVPPQGPGVGSVPDGNRKDGATELNVECLPDPKLLEALESPKDRIMVLKLEQDFVDFVKDPKEASLTLPQLNGYHRMLAHRLADYYMLGHVVEDSMAVQIFKTANCRLAPPLTAVAPPSTAASTPPPTGPQMKILRRGDNVGPTIANGSSSQSKTGSENGESGNDDDKKSKYPLSREEREAKYEAARKRIMGSARPSETSEETNEKDDSRSSSVAPKKSKKKQRNDSDDDFEARSAYSAYYTTPLTASGLGTPQYGFTNIPPAPDAQTSQSGYGQQGAGSHGQHFMGPGVAWQNQTAFQQQPQGPQAWMPNAHTSYDLSSDFQRAMSLQGMPSPHANGHPSWPTQYQQQQYGSPQQQWQGQSPYATSLQAQNARNFGDNFRPSSSSSMQNQPYAYGQLPSQTFPGRPPSNLEHPLPGSYKGKHFNPQSQSFIPNFNAPHANTMSVQAFMSQVPAPSSHAQYNAYGMPPVQNQPHMGYQHQVAPQGHPSYQPQQPQRSPHQQQHQQQQQQQSSLPQMPPPPQPAAQPAAHRSPGQPLTHPLPQPVFPRQPSPNMPLPPKPGATPPKSQEQGAGLSQTQDQQQQKESTIAKWGSSSLPAKPPPSTEPFDPARFAQNQRQASHGSRIPSNSSGYGQVTAMGRM